MLPFFLYFIIISYLASLTSFKKYSPRYLRYLSFFLLIVIIVEILGGYLKKIKVDNNVLYNIYTIAETLFYSYLLNIFLNNKIIARVTLLFLPVFVLFCIANILFIQGPHEMNTYSIIIESVFLVYLIINYFRKLLLSEESIDLFREPSFWICWGLLIYFLASMSYVGIINFLELYIKWMVDIYQTVMTIINIFLYSLFTIAFLCRINIRRS